MPGKKITKETTPIGIDEDKDKNSGMKGFFHKCKPPKQTVQAVIRGECTEERAVDQETTEYEDDEMEEEDDELTDLEIIQRKVFTGKSPDFI